MGLKNRGFLTEFPPFLRITIKIVTYMIDSMVLHYWPRFQTYLTPFWGVMAKKHPQISQKSCVFLLPKHLKFEKSGTTNHIHVKLGPDRYHLNTFPLPRNGGVNQWAGGGASKKSPKITMKLT